MVEFINVSEVQGMTAKMRHEKITNYCFILLTLESKSIWSEVEWVEFTKVQSELD